MREWQRALRVRVTAGAADASPSESIQSSMSMDEELNVSPAAFREHIAFLQQLRAEEQAGHVVLHIMERATAPALEACGYLPQLVGALGRVGWNGEAFERPVAAAEVLDAIVRCGHEERQEQEARRVTAEQAEAADPSACPDEWSAAAVRCAGLQRA